MMAADSQDFDPVHMDPGVGSVWETYGVRGGEGGTVM